MGSHFWLNLIATTYILFKTFHFHCGLKMIRISVLLGLFLLVSGVLLPGIPQNFDDRDTDEEVAELLTDLFREAKDIDIENEVENNDVEDDLEEQKLNTDPVEVAKYNTYMDAVYRRMNAALRAKLMDPMELNLDSKQKKLKEPIKVPRRTNLRKLLKDKRQRKEIQERLMMKKKRI